MEVTVFNALPDEVQLMVFERLLGGGGHLFQAMQVCRQWLRLCISDALWQEAYLALLSHRTEEKARKVKTRFHELKNGLEEQKEQSEQSGDAAEGGNWGEREHKRTKLKKWFKAQMHDEAHPEQALPELSWRELTRSRYSKFKKLATVRLKPLPETLGEKLVEIVVNSSLPDGEIKARYLNSLNPNVSEETDTTRVVQSDTPLLFLPPLPGQRSDTKLAYYEIKVEDKGEKGYISVGVAPLNFDQRNIQVGWDPRSKSYGMHGDDGHKYPALLDSVWSWMGDEYGPQFTTGDVVGCGVIVRRISEEEATRKTLQELDKRAKAWRRKMMNDSFWKNEAADPESENKHAQQELQAEREEMTDQHSLQEKLYFLLDWDDRVTTESKKSLFCRAKALFNKSKSEYRSYMASIFWTKNGQYLGLGFSDLIVTDADDYRPSVGMHSPGETVNFNFGRVPFMFDVDDFMLNYPQSLSRPTPPPFKRDEADQPSEEEYTESSDWERSSSNGDDELPEEELAAEAGAPASDT